MNDELINVESQIVKKQDKIIIYLTPNWFYKRFTKYGRSLRKRKISEDVYITIAVAIIALIIMDILGNVFRFGLPLPAFLSILFGFVVVLIILFDSFYVSKLTISKTLITTNTERKKSLKNIPFIDFEVEVLEDKVKVSMQDFQFNLRNIKDLPKLTEGVAELLDLEFYDNYQMQNKKEVLTYKAKTIAKPNFPSFLAFRNKRAKLEIRDIRSQFRYILIEKKSPITKIVYSKPTDLEGRYGMEYIIETKNIQKIVVYTLQKISVLSKNQRVVVTAFMKVGEPQVVLLRTTSRKSKDELTNWRDGERVYELLKAIPNLNIPIEKKLIN